MRHMNMKIEKQIEEKYAGRFYYKTVVSDLIGEEVTIRIDKIELTDEYKAIIDEVELKVARQFLHREPTEKDMHGFYEDLQLPMYAGVCDAWRRYYVIKHIILRDEYGIEWLSYPDLNDPTNR